MYLASGLISHGHAIEVFIDRDINRLVSQIKQYHPDIVGFSCTTGMHSLSLEIAKAIKSRIKTLTVFGGAHPTFFPEIIREDAVDIVCIGEGENALLEIAEAIDQRSPITRISNCWVKQDGSIAKNELRPLTEDLDALPFPDRSIYYHKYPFMNYSQKVFIAGRGCPYDCTYCFNNSLKNMYKDKGKYIRLRSVENVISEISEVRRSYGLRTVYMIDDTFILNRTWVSQFLEVYQEKIRLPFICLVRADLITQDIARRLKEANCYSVFFGIESGSERLRNLILNKRITNAKIIEAAALLKKHKIKFRTYNMLGIPGEGLDDAFMTVDLNIKIKTDYPWCSILQPYPKTSIMEYARNKGMLKEADLSRLFFHNSILNLPNIRELSNLQKLFYWSVKFPFLKPLVKKAIKLPPNFIFKILFLIGYAYSYYRSERRRFGEVSMIGWLNRRIL